jgi:quercetin dioxygenase-like cupin family protein
MISTKELKLVADQDIPWTDLGGGMRRKIMSYNDNIMLTKIDFEKGAIGALHSHPHVQISYITAGGKFKVTIGNETKLLKDGDVYFVPANEKHGVVCVKEGQLIDVFTPMREDFLS